MNGPERGGLITSAILVPLGVLMVVIGAGLAMRTEGGTVAVVSLALFTSTRTAARWRQRYESTRDRPRAENWREN
jgi:hypothetical protein